VTQPGFWYTTRAVSDETENGSNGHPKLTQIRTTGYSVVSLPNQWFILAASSELKSVPLARMLMGTPLVLFRDANGKAGALLDRCPHRNVPLSLGEVAKDGNLQCPYHGWRFDRGGECRAVPSYTGTPEARGRACTAHPVIEQQGFVWVYSTPWAPGETAMPKNAPHFFARADDPDYVTVRQAIDQKGTLFSALENALDVPHTAFLHRGLFRGSGERHDLLFRDARCRRLGVHRELRVLARRGRGGAGERRHLDEPRQRDPHDQVQGPRAEAQARRKLFARVPGSRRISVRVRHPSVDERQGHRRVRIWIRRASAGVISISPAAVIAIT